MNLVFLSFYSGIHTRGVETFVHELTNRLVKLGHSVKVFQGGPDLPSPSSFPQLPSTTDWVVPLNGRLQALKASLWTKVHGKKLLISGQSGPGFDDRLNLLLFPTVFVALTEFQRLWAKKVNPFVKIITIPNGVNLQAFSKKVNPLRSVPVILSVAALTPAKRLDLLIKSAAATSASLVLVGDGDLREYLQNLGDTLMPHRFKIISTSYEKIPAIYTQADVFAFPTVSHESFGIVLLEAMATGLPIVTTDDPIRREIVGTAGLFIDPTNIDSFSAALRTALAAKTSNLSRSQAEKFSWDKIAQSYSDIFDS